MKMDKRFFDALLMAIDENGPQRVIVDANGKSVSFPVALRTYRANPDFVLVREDGWSLGCSLAHSDAAFDLWAGEWRCFLIVGRTRPFDMSRWVERAELLRILKEATGATKDPEPDLFLKRKGDVSRET